MSDYLWDKTGEPEEDVARLEQLLGTLRHEPRPFVLPADFSAQPARSTFRPQRQQQRPFGWQRRALAASLLLTLLAGAWLVVRLNQPEVRREAAEQKLVTPQTTNEQTPQKQIATVNGAHDQPAPKPAVTRDIERVNYQPAKHVSKRAGTKARRHTAQPVANQAQEQIANAKMTPEQKAATEQLLLALRIASAKYNYAQREVQELSAAHKPETR